MFSQISLSSLIQTQTNRTSPPRSDLVRNHLLDGRDNRSDLILDCKVMVGVEVSYNRREGFLEVLFLVVMIWVVDVLIVGGRGIIF